MPSATSRFLHVGWALVAAIALFGVCTILGGRLRAVRAAVPPVDERLFIPTPQAARVLSAGYNEAAADIAWARALVYYGDGMLHGFALQDVEPLVELVNALDPHFKRAYEWGAHATTFRQREATQEEFRASIKILERGIKVFPNDWRLAWMLGIRYYIDLKEDDPVLARQLKELGASYIERAMRMPGAPPEMPTFAASLRTKLGQRERALRELREMILNTDDGKARDQLIERYEALASSSVADALREAKQAFDAERKAALPYAPASMFVLVGSRKPMRSAHELMESSLLSFDTSREDEETISP